MFYGVKSTVAVDPRVRPVNPSFSQIRSSHSGVHVSNGGERPVACDAASKRSRAGWIVVWGAIGAVAGAVISRYPFLFADSVGDARPQGRLVPIHISAVLFGGVAALVGWWTNQSRDARGRRAAGTSSIETAKPEAVAEATAAPPPTGIDSPQRAAAVRRLEICHPSQSIVDDQRWCEITSRSRGNPAVTSIARGGSYANAAGSAGTVETLQARYEEVAMRFFPHVALILSAFAASACSTASPPAVDLMEAGADSLAPDAGSPVETALVQARQFGLVVPKGYDSSRPAPLVLLLHGYGGSGDSQLKYFGFEAVANKRTVFVAHPDGLLDSKGSRYWEGSGPCCDFDHSQVDDVAYLTAVVHDVQKRYAIDPKRIFAVGHSNGAFMAHRLGCERAELFAAVFSVAGAQFIDASKCRPSRPVSVVELHGDADDTISYTGGSIKDRAGRSTDYPSASQTVATWAELDGCVGPIASSGKTLDLDWILPGAETAVSTFGTCAGLAGVELWTIAGGHHTPALSSAFADIALDFLLAHPMP
jgi:polyhydroxybutyrate depolymerase